MIWDQTALDVGQLYRLFRILIHKSQVHTLIVMGTLEDKKVSTFGQPLIILNIGVIQFIIIAFKFKLFIL